MVSLRIKKLRCLRSRYSCGMPSLAFMLTPLCSLLLPRWPHVFFTVCFFRPCCRCLSCVSGREHVRFWWFGTLVAFMSSVSFTRGRLCRYALRDGFGAQQSVSTYCGTAYGLRHFMGIRFRRVHGHRPPEVCKSPWSLRGPRVYAPHGCLGLMAGYAACCTQYIRHFSLAPCAVTVH